MKRLYLKIYLTIIVSLLMVVLVAGLFWRFGADEPMSRPGLGMISELVGAALPPADAPAAIQQQRIDRLADRLDADLALYDEAHGLIAASATTLALPSPTRVGRHFDHHGSAWSLQLPDRRWVVARLSFQHQHSAIRLAAILGSIALLVALCAYPVVTRPDQAAGAPATGRRDAGGRQSGHPGGGRGQ